MTKFHLQRLTLRFVRLFFSIEELHCAYIQTDINAIYRLTDTEGEIFFCFYMITWHCATCTVVSQHTGIIACRIGGIMRYWHNVAYAGMILSSNLYHSVMTWASLQWPFGVMISHSHNDLPLYWHNDILAYLHICILSISWHNDILTYWPYHDVMMLLSLHWPPQGSGSHCFAGILTVIYDIRTHRMAYWLIQNIGKWHWHDLVTCLPYYQDGVSVACWHYGNATLAHSCISTHWHTVA